MKFLEEKFSLAKEIEKENAEELKFKDQEIYELKTRVNNLNQNMNDQSNSKANQNMSKEVSILNNIIKKKEEKIKILTTKLNNFEITIKSRDDLLN